MMPSLLAGALAVFLASNASPAAGGDWFASLYTGEGVELRTDARIFHLFAAFNAAGFDEGPIGRRHPFPRKLYHPARQELRARVMASDPALRKQLETFLDAHPLPIERYLACSLSPP